MTKEIKNKGMSELKKEILIGAEIVSLMAGIAGTYFLYGSESARKNRKKIKSWAFKAKGEVLEQLENMKDMSEEAYRGVVKEIADKYKNLKNIDASKIEEFASELFSYWSKIKNDAEKVVIGQSKPKAQSVKAKKRKNALKKRDDLRK